MNREDNKRILECLDAEFKKLECDVLILNTMPSEKCFDDIFTLIYTMDDEVENSEFTTKDEVIDIYNKIKKKEVDKFNDFIKLKHNGFKEFFELVKGYCPINYFDAFKELKNIYSSKVNLLKEEKIKSAFNELSYMDDIFYEILDKRFKVVSTDEILLKIAEEDECKETSKGKSKNKDFSYKKLNGAARKLGYQVRRYNGSHAIYKNTYNEVIIIPQSTQMGKGLKISIAKKLNIS